ncbi:MAG: WecB/TagA/CpsF family glycosyltransferase [bacterium]|nr:WecB/TagA/CpsF family glycosyltransferase [bacterium]
MQDKVNICGIEIDNLDLEGALERFDQMVKNKKPSIVVTPNLDHIVNYQKDEDFQRIYNSASLVLADGVPLLWAGKFLGTPIREKLSGSDVFHDICRVGAEKGYRFFFMGGREGAAAQTAEIMQQRHPDIKIVGFYCPPMGFENNEEESAKIAKMIKKAKPDIMFLGLGSPKQEKWADRFSAELGIPITVGIGITFEYTCGMVQRAPVWMQKVGLEWFYRLIKEPKRLWKRYLINDPRFFWLVLKQRFGKKKDAAI